jgi:hypothetical protein
MYYTLDLLRWVSVGDLNNGWWRLRVERDIVDILDCRMMGSTEERHIPGTLNNGFPRQTKISESKTFLYGKGLCYGSLVAASLEISARLA